ncbi:hypothetical protein JTE90_016463 [Oedothorax gibbosus]|uniref:Uncharacterized protein n=1 Tax=Oedothorax gibbosus TaxID=931172 RepID=A0AAV6V5W2_9ARAC|nr:hypothetical protein JTE90_016463 [Oedothorax gibbosus]
MSPASISLPVPVTTYFTQPPPIEHPLDARATCQTICRSLHIVCAGRTLSLTVRKTHILDCRSFFGKFRARVFSGVVLLVGRCNCIFEDFYVVRGSEEKLWPSAVSSRDIWSTNPVEVSFCFVWNF